MAKTKINVAIEEDLLREVDDYCDKNYTNRSYLICKQLVEVLNRQKMIDSIRDLSFSLKKASEVGKLDEELEAKMEEFEALCNLMTDV